MTNPHSAIPIDIGSRLELMVDDCLIARLSGGTQRRLNRPIPQAVALRMDAPWEGNASGGFTVFQDGGLYRMYYRGQNFVYCDTGLGSPRGKFVCYAESDDGIHWVKPELGLVEFDGSTKNNIIMDAESILNGMFAPFKDGNPDCPPDARYKSFALMQRGDARGLWAYRSPDGIHWTEMSDGPVITKGLLDTQNLAFWDAQRGEYRAYHRNEFRLSQTGEEPYSSHPTQAAGASRTGMATACADRATGAIFSPPPPPISSTGPNPSLSTTTRDARTSFTQTRLRPTTERRISIWASRPAMSNVRGRRR